MLRVSITSKENRRVGQGIAYCRVAVAVGMAIFMVGSLAACGNGDDSASGVTTATATLMWDPVADPNIQGYKIYYGTASRSQAGSYPWSVNTEGSTVYTVADLQRGTTYYFAVTAYNASGLESEYSEEVSITKT